MSFTVARLLCFATLLWCQTRASIHSFGAFTADDIRDMEIDSLVKSNEEAIQKLLGVFTGELQSHMHQQVYEQIVEIVWNAVLQAESIDAFNSSTPPTVLQTTDDAASSPVTPTLPGGPTTDQATRSPTTHANVPTTGDGPCFPPGSCDGTTQAAVPTTGDGGGGPCFPPGSCDGTTQAGLPITQETRTTEPYPCIEAIITLPEPISLEVILKICLNGSHLCLRVELVSVLPTDPLYEGCPIDLGDLPSPFPKNCPFSIPLPAQGDILTFLQAQSFTPVQPLVTLPSLPALPTELPDTIANVSTECFMSELQFVLDLVCSPRELYAFEMFDAMGKLPSGLLKGDLRWLGAFMQCRDIDGVHIWMPFAENSTYDANYCLSTWSISTSDAENATNIPLQIGVCFPELCSSEDIATLLQLAFSAIAGDTLTIETVYCDYDTPLDTGAKVFLLILLVIITVVVIASVVDYVIRVRHQADAEIFDIDADGVAYVNNAYEIREYDIEMTEAQDPSPPEKVTLDQVMEKAENQAVDGDHDKQNDATPPPTKSQLIAEENVYNTLYDSDSKAAKISSPLRAFSGFINGSKIFSTDYDPDDPDHPLMMVHGLRVLTLWWIIYQMTYSTAYEVLQNPVDLVWMAERFSSQAIDNGSFATDTFFVISGFLITYLGLRKLKEDGSSWKMWLVYYFHRVWRFWPAYIVILLMYMWYLPFMVAGPLKYIAADYVKPCYDYWWTNVLFINNLYPYFEPLRDKCMPWSWYIACVMQFYIISPFIILLLHWKMVVGYIVIGLLFAVDFTCTALISTYYGLTASPGQSRFNDNADDNPFGDYIDTKPQTRIATYLVGMCLAHILIKHQQGCFKVTTKVSALMWLISTFLGITIVYCTYGTYHEPKWEQGLTVFYITVSRFTFGLAIAWVIFACATGHGGVVNSFLSWNFWLPLSRMSFCTYLVFPLMMAFWLLNNHVQPYVSDFNFMYLFIAYMGMGFLVGFSFALIVERPFMQLERLMFGKGLEESK